MGIAVAALIAAYGVRKWIHQKSLNVLKRAVSKMQDDLRENCRWIVGRLDQAGEKIMDDIMGAVELDVEERIKRAQERLNELRSADESKVAAFQQALARLQALEA